MFEKRNVLKAASLGAIVLAASGLASAQSRPGNAGRPVGQVVKIQEAGDVSASPGDLIQIQVTYPVIPGAFLDDLDVAVAGPSARLATVASTPLTGPDGRPTYGAGSLSAFIVASGDGQATIKVTPIKQGGGRGEERVYRLTIKSRQGP